jgi:hypothetical protein
MRKEKEFSIFIHHELTTLLANQDLQISEEKNILTDVTCIYEKGKFELVHGFAQTDIAIFKPITFDNKTVPTSLIKFYGDKDVKNGELAIPFVILELKSGELTTDGIRSRDFVASRIKEMYPFSAYYFLAEGTKKEEKTLLRQGKNFTNYFISKEEFSKEEIKEIFLNHIQPHLQNINRQFKL